MALRQILTKRLLSAMASHAALETSWTPTRTMEYARYCKQAHHPSDFNKQRIWGTMYKSFRCASSFSKLCCFTNDQQINSGLDPRLQTRTVSSRTSSCPCRASRFCSNRSLLRSGIRETHQMQVLFFPRMIASRAALASAITYLAFCLPSHKVETLE